MRRIGITLIEIVVILATIGILAAILMPVFRRPPRFHAAVIPPQHFNRVPLQSVIARLDQALQASRAQQGKKPVDNLKKVMWEKDELKFRPVTLHTKTAMPLKKVLVELEQTANITVSFGPGCGTCGSYDGPTTVSEKQDRPEN